MKNKTRTNPATAVIRREFSFYADDDSFNDILADLAAEGVTIIALTVTALNMGVNFVRMVVGPPNSNSSFANMVARNALTSAGVRFREKKVIQIIAAPSPGRGLRIFQALRNVRLIAAYTGVNSIILNVSNIKTALAILMKKNIIR